MQAPFAARAFHRKHQQSICRITPATMNCRIVLFFVVVLVALALLSGSAGASSYRKAPFNGSIFGKRSSGTSADVAESRVAAYPSLCEVALEACSSWVPVSQDST
ncbi:neuropeptide SIFamide-like [Hetaerina americana]|uniref:neuropeptide SIFamide-like n=1 Tax=Hetaerina americana TaxID=62018 RepID=UPI003A7F340C